MQRVRNVHPANWRRILITAASIQAVGLVGITLTIDHAPAGWRQALLNIFGGILFGALAFSVVFFVASFVGSLLKRR